MKPALFKNEVLGVADPIATILFIGLWTLADRRGILEDRPMRIKAEVFPYREGIDAEGLLAWLDREGFIQRYEVDGKACIQINNFAKHQNPHKNEEPSELPDAQGNYAASPKGRAGGFNPLSACPANVSPEVWADWCQHRKEIRKPLTQKACQQQAKTLESVPAPDEVLRKSIANGWMGLFPDRPGNVHPFPRRPEGPDFHSGDTTWAQDLGVL